VIRADGGARFRNARARDDDFRHILRERNLGQEQRRCGESDRAPDGGSVRHERIPETSELGLDSFRHTLRRGLNDLVAMIHDGKGGSARVNRTNLLLPLVYSGRTMKRALWFDVAMLALILIAATVSGIH
jgi:hypothetical protein